MNKDESMTKKYTNDQKQHMKDRMTAGELYFAPALPDNYRKSLMDKFNQADRAEYPSRTEKYLRDFFGSMGKDCYIEGPFYADHGFNIHLGDGVYMNTDCVILDQCPVHIGDRTLIGPKVQILCAMHPIDARVRGLLAEYGKPITIGKDVWIGGGVIICPGVTIGDNAVIGAGSVVTKDIPANVIAAGNPCRVIRKITSEDTKYWEDKLTEFQEDTGIVLDENLSGNKSNQNDDTNKEVKSDDDYIYSGPEPEIPDCGCIYG